MKETNKKLAERLAGIFLDPILLYSTVMVMAIMYHYHKSMTFVYGIVTLIAGILLFRLFDFTQKHKFTGGVIYVAVAAGTLWLAGQCAEIGQIDYPISWMVWFLTPQDAVKFNLWYTYSVFVFFVVFMMSVVYYFTRVRYRLFMNFLIVMVPFELYGKEYEKMPTLFIILIAVGYILLMVRYRTLNETGEVRVIEHAETWRSIAAYAVVFAVAAAVVPKPKAEADRTYLERLIDADKFTDRMLAMLNAFRDTTSNDIYLNSNSNTPAYYVSSPEPLRLKLGSYSVYDYTKDSWSVAESDTRFIYRTEDYPVTMFSNADLLAAFVEAAYYDEDFAERYGLTELGESVITYPESREIEVYTAYQQGQFAPVPQFATRLVDSSCDDEIALIGAGMIYKADGWFAGSESYRFRYDRDSLFTTKENRAAAAMLCRDDYADILADASDILNNAYETTSDDEFAEFLEPLCLAIKRDLSYYQKYASSLTLYGNNERIRELAQQITADCETDYEKAKALEGYFYSSGFIYDQSYRKNSGDNAETFLFTSRRGVCYEYATAMVLMARSLGIPARYCEGYNMTREEKNDRFGTNMLVTYGDAHAYPELYIRGAGWMSFEPTVADLVQEEETANTATKTLSRAGFIMFAAAALLMLFILMLPRISHRIFLILIRRREPNRAVSSAMHRICRLYGIGRENTSREAAQAVAELSGADIMPLAVLFDRAEYGGMTLTEADRTSAEQIYTAAYTAYRENKGKRRRATNRTDG